MTANSTEADTELGAWRQPERGGGCKGRFVGREGRRGAGGRGVHRQTERQTDLEEKTNERVMKQVDVERRRSMRGEKIHTLNLV